MTLRSFAICARYAFTSKMPLRILVTSLSSNAFSTRVIVASGKRVRKAQFQP